MLKLRALNRESSSDEDAPAIRREAQEEIVLDTYNKALKLQFNGQYEESEKLLQELIEENIPSLENEGGLPKTMSTLKYSCYVNLGNIAMKQEDSEKALKHYSVASDLDKKDVTLWHKIGKIALKLDKFRQASYAFSMGLECNESHWPCLDELISVLYAVNDTVSCLCYIGKALILDPNYTKGLVFRKKIYENNPATKDYYKLYNPDFILEPSLDLPVDEEDEVYFLNQVQVLCDRITEVEKALGPQPLPCIPLPYPLEEFTWVAVGKTLTGLHRYISENSMTHFSFIDLKKCMSTDVKSVIVESEEAKMEVDGIKNVEVELDSKVETPFEAVSNEPKAIEISTDVQVERRMSQNSEVNSMINETTENMNATQTDDNDDMEQDGDDQDETMETRNDKSRTQNRTSKRKRDLLSDLQIWGWHSKRKYAKKSKTEKDFTVEDALTRVIPSHLLPNGIVEEKYNPCEDSMNTMEIYHLHVEDNHMSSIPSPVYSPKSLESNNYFGSDLEKEDVQMFWTQKWECCDAVNLIEGFVFALATKWKLVWPKELVPLYIEAYNMFREHCSHPPLQGRESVTFEMLRIDGLATVLYGELTSFDISQIKSKKEDENDEKLTSTSLVHIQYLSAWDEKWGDEHAEFFIRVHWLRAHLFRIEQHNALAICCLQLIQEAIEQQENKMQSPRYKVVLPNSHKYNLINSKIVEALLKNLEMIDSLNRLEDLYNAQKYKDVATVLKSTFTSSSYHVTCGRMGRPAQLGMLLHSLWYTDMADCFVWTEECLFESVENYIRPKKDHDKWEMLVDKCLQFLHEIIKLETVCVVDNLEEDKRIRLIESLTRICCKQLNMENPVSIPLGTILPWIILHYVLLREEQRQQAKKRVSHVKKEDEKVEDKRDSDLPEEEEIPASVAILFSGHEFLGQKGWCLTAQGQLLHFIVDVVLDKLDTPMFESLRDKLDIHLEQAFFCLYQHPSKKNKVSRHLADHNVNPLPLTWERAQQIYEFFSPCALPEFDSYKSISISSELEQLLQRITSLVPQECDPQPLIPKVIEFINGSTDKIADPIEFLPKTRSMYYLLGDYYFKQSEVKKSTKYFQMDLCINPWRLDSWACMALGIASQLEQKLTHCERFKTESEFFDKAKSTKICFQQALTIANDHVTLWIEYGSFEYMVHSYCSRLLKYESETFSMEKFAELESTKESYLESSEKSFLRALELYNADQSDADERWLYHYMIAKISEKCQKEPNDYLQHYLTAAALLQENNATYPEKINYNNPPTLSVEALEVNYRINASILKYMELHEGKDISNSLGKTFRKCLEIAAFPKHGETKKAIESKVEKTDKSTDPTENPTEDEIKSLVAQGLSQKTERLEVSSDVKSCVEDLITQVEEQSLEMQKEAKELDSVKENDSDKGKPMSVDNDQNIASDESAKEKDVVEIKNKDEGLDIIVLSDSDEDVIEMNEDPLTITPSTEDHARNIQDIMDQMMKETMDKQSTLVDSDMEVTPAEVVVDTEEALKAKPRRKLSSNDEKLEGTSDKGKESKDDAVKANVLEPKSEKGKESETERKSAEESTSSSSSSSDSSSSDSDSDDSSSTSSSSSSDVSSGNLSDTEVIFIVDRCIVGLENCIRRLPQNYKAIYRLSHLYFHYNKKKDLTKSKQLFLGEYKCKNNVLVTGLFSDRKTNNFFNGVWRIPSSEIDRPGSLSAHMGRCVTLLLQILRATNDNKTLLDLCLLLRRTPDADKIYIRHSEREQLAEQALSLCIQTLRVQIKNADTNAAYNKLLGELFKAYQRSQKSLTSKESVFAGMLSDVYKRFIGDKLAENANVLDLAVKYCQQNRAAEKLKRQQTQAALPKAPILSTTPPVMPTPTTNVTQPLKRPSLGRPRGRPPGPKTVAGQSRAPKGRSPLSSTTNPYWNSAMFESKTAYDYLRQYQEHLIRQYNQTLNLTQMAQLMQSQYTPTTTTTSNILNPTSLLQSMQQLSSGLHSVSPNQLTQSLSMLNPSLLKKLTEQIAMTNLASPSTTQMSQLTTEQLRQLTALMQTTKAPSTKSTSTNLGQSGKTSKSSMMYTQASSSKTSTKTSTGDNVKSKSKESSKSSTTYQTIKDLQIIPTNAQTTSQDLEKAALLMKERPNISITPVSQSVLTSSKPATVVKSSPPTFTSGLNSSTTSKLSSSSLPKPISTITLTSSKSSTSTSVGTKPSQLSNILKPTHTHLPKSSSIHNILPKSSKPSPVSSPALPLTGNIASSTPIPGTFISSAHTKSSTPTSIFPKSTASVSNMVSNLMCPPTSTSPTKTLQEKLADKQKQAMGKNLSKAFEQEPAHQKSNSTSSFYKSLGAQGLPSSISVIPTFPTDNSVSVTQVTGASTKTKPLEGPAINIYRVGEHGSSSTKLSSNTSSGIDLSSRTSTGKKSDIPERKHSSDDDVIFIE